MLELAAARSIRLSAGVSLGSSSCAECYDGREVAFIHGHRTMETSLAQRIPKVVIRIRREYGVFVQGAGM